MNGERPKLLCVLATIVRILYEERPGLLRALGTAALVVFLVMVLLLDSVLDTPTTWESVVQVAQGLVTTLAVLIGGIWAFYIFILGRTFSASVQIQLELKQVRIHVGCTVAKPRS
jgi:hypothetical protein